MKRTLLAAMALAAAPAMGEDATPDMAAVTALADTRCADLVRIVIDRAPRDETERRIGAAAAGIVMGRALGTTPKADDFQSALSAEMARFTRECLTFPDSTWFLAMLAMQEL